MKSAMVEQVQRTEPGGVDMGSLPEPIRAGVSAGTLKATPIAGDWVEFDILDGDVLVIDSASRGGVVLALTSIGEIVIGEPYKIDDSAMGVKNETRFGKVAAIVGSIVHVQHRARRNPPSEAALTSLATVNELVYGPLPADATPYGFISADQADAITNSVLHVPPSEFVQIGRRHLLPLGRFRAILTTSQPHVGLNIGDTVHVELTPTSSQDDLVICRRKNGDGLIARVDKIAGNWCLTNIEQSSEQLLFPLSDVQTIAGKIVKHIPVGRREAWQREQTAAGIVVPERPTFGLVPATTATTGEYVQITGTFPKAIGRFGGTHSEYGRLVRTTARLIVLEGTREDGSVFEFGRSARHWAITALIPGGKEAVQEWVAAIAVAHRRKAALLEEEYRRKYGFLDEAEVLDLTASIGIRDGGDLVLRVDAPQIKAKAGQRLRIVEKELRDLQVGDVLLYWQHGYGPDSYVCLGMVEHMSSQTARVLSLTDVRKVRHHIRLRDMTPKGSNTRLRVPFIMDATVIGRPTVSPLEESLQRRRAKGLTTTKSDAINRALARKKKA